MKDNQLYNHFKTHSTAFDEMPGEDLWAKIESGLENTKPTNKPNILLFIVCGIALTASIIWYFAIPESTAKINTTAKPVTITAPEPENIITNKPQINTLPSVSATAEKTTSSQTSVILKNAETVVTIVQDSVKKVTVRTAKIKPVPTAEKTTAMPYIKFRSYTKGTIAPLGESPTFEVQKKETFGNIIVSTKQKITADEYQKLIDDMLKQNETSVGTLLTIKAPGHKPFRKVIGTESTKGFVKTANADSIIINPVKVEPLNPTLQQEKIQVNSSYINPEHVSFSRITTTTNDSLPKGNNKLKE